MSRTAAVRDSTPPPDDLTVDCSTGDVTCVPLTPDQVAAQQQAASQIQAQQQAAANARAQQIAAVAASTDPAVHALGQLLGLIS